MSRTTLTSEIIRSQTIAEYGLAASEAAQRDIDSIVTCEDIARRSGVQVESMRRFFRKHPELKKKWGVLDPAEVTEKRYRGAVSRMRSRRGRKRPITRGRLAKELGCTVTSVYEYLRQHPALVQELEITRG